MWLRVAVGVACLWAAAPASAQSVREQLSTLFVEQGPPGTHVPDLDAAEITRRTITDLFAIEITTLPITPSTGGFSYRLDPRLGLYERATNVFGPFFSERALQNTPGRMTFGLSYQFADFATLQGARLRDGSFSTTSSRRIGSADHLALDALYLHIESLTFVPSVSYALTDDLALSVAVPVINVWFAGERVRFEDGATTRQTTQTGSATGVGDVAVTARYLLWGAGSRGVAIGGDVRFPTGRAEDLLGTGQASGRILGIASWEDGLLALHANAGAGAGGASEEAFWSTAASFAAAPRVTIVGELMGHFLTDLRKVTSTYATHPLADGVETLRWVPAARGVHTVYAVAGLKWNVFGNWLLNGNVLVRLTEGGLRARVAPGLSLDLLLER